MASSEPGNASPAVSQATVAVPPLPTSKAGENRGRTKTPWTPAEDERLKQMHDAGHRWSEIAKAFPNRTPASVQRHWHNRALKVEFTIDEISALGKFIKQYEANKWKTIGHQLGKPAKACEKNANMHFKPDSKAFKLDAKKPTSAKITRETRYDLDQRPESSDYDNTYALTNTRAASLDYLEDIHRSDRAKSNINSGVLNVPSVKSQDQLAPQPPVERSVSPSMRVPLPLSPTISMSGLYHSRHSESEISSAEMSMTSRSLFFAMDELHGQTMAFIEELASKVVLQSVALSDRRGLSLHAPSPCEPNKSTSSVTTTQAIPNRRTSSSKRCLHDDSERDTSSNDEDKDGGGEPHRKRKRGSPGKLAKLFACPFAKFHPDRYSERNLVEKNYRKCSSKYLRDITRLKQHLYRTHMRPEWYCGNCYKRFNSREQLNEHNRERPPCGRSAIRYEEMMTDNQLREIRRRRPGNSQYETWYKIFLLLFPDAPRPATPYVSTCDPETIQHFVSVFQLAGPQELFQMMQARRENGPESVQLSISTQAIVDEAFEIALPDYLELLESGQRRQHEQVDIAAPSERQSQDHPSNSSSFSQETNNLTVATHTMASQILQMPQAAQQDPDSMLQPDWTAQPNLDGSHALPSDITQLFDPFETLFGSPNVQIFEQTTLGDDPWSQVNV